MAKPLTKEEVVLATMDIEIGVDKVTKAGKKYKSTYCHVVWSGLNSLLKNHFNMDKDEISELYREMAEEELLEAGPVKGGYGLYEVGTKPEARGNKGDELMKSLGIKPKKKRD